jgi:hypothetical protein
MMKKPVQLATEDGLFELTGAESIWIWAHTCPAPDCACRLALILATTDGREALAKRGRGVREAWNAGSGYATVASTLKDVEVFRLDIDSLEAFPLTDEHPLDLATHPRVRSVVERLDGEVLDDIGRLFYCGKGKPDPETRLRAAQEIVLKGWSRGNMLPFDDVCGVRRDLYLFDGNKFEATEMYCPIPECTCGEVLVDFEWCKPPENRHAGRVLIPRVGAIRIEPTRSGQSGLEQLWQAFQKRHPRYRERFARRGAVLKDLGTRLPPERESPRAETQAKVGRNDPCPCGSGKKFKKCCAAASGAATGPFNPAVSTDDIF